jgi:hypothetical protein
VSCVLGAFGEKCERNLTLDFSLKVAETSDVGMLTLRKVIYLQALCWPLLVFHANLEAIRH